MRIGGGWKLVEKTKFEQHRQLKIMKLHTRPCYSGSTKKSEKVNKDAGR